MIDPATRTFATDANFEAELYLAANPDVRRHVERGGSAWTHFDRHGRREGRTQLTPEAAGLVGSRRHRKLARFADALDARRGAGGAFRPLGEPNAFPLGYGDGAHDPADYEGESANPGFGDFVEHVRAHPEQRFADIGCGRRSETLDNCLYVEVYPSVSADLVIAPACRYPIADASLDGIGCFAVLEHVRDPRLAAAEFARMLKPGGLAFIDYPFLVPVHGYPSHYFNATREGLLELFAEAFETISVETYDNQTPDHAIHWQLRELRDAIPDEALRAELEGTTIADLLAAEPGEGLWHRIVASLPPEPRRRLAAGNTLIARRR